jgi:hypothetical protein
MIPAQLIRDGLGVAASAFWVKGMNSASDPAFLEDTNYRSAMNIVNRGGIIKTRPGYTCLLELPPGKLQGYKLFKPTGGPNAHVFAVSGKVYVFPEPFTSYYQLSNVQFLADADFVVFEETVKSVVRNEDGTLSLVDPYRVLIMQDSYTRAAFWDGENSRHLDPSASEIPLGLWMKWSGDRLWVGRDDQLFASDIADPLSFTETEYLAEGGSFRINGNITALAEVSSVDTPQLLVFTASSTTSVQSNIRDRALWKTTDNFQRTLLPDVGCVSGRAIATQYGQLWWMTTTGITSLNAALSSRVSSELVFRDTEMAVSKGNLSPNIEKIAAASFENYLLFSMPSGDLYNRHTWVMDQSVMDSLNGKAAAAWNGVWTGTRPVEWSGGVINGVRRVFHVSKDFDGKNRLWEAFIPSREDNGQPITCYVETKSHANFHEEAQGLDIKTFRFAELEFTEISGTLDIKVYWAGLRGNYKQLTTFRFVSPDDSINNSRTFNLDSNLFSYRPQSRTVRTTEVLDDSKTDGQCGIESDIPARHDRAFSLLIVWSGKAALRSYRVFARKYDESGVGARGGEVEEINAAEPIRQGLIDKLDDCDNA